MSSNNVDGGSSSSSSFKESESSPATTSALEEMKRDSAPSSDPVTDGEPVNVKIIHFVRHGEGFHNIGFQDTEDTHLTDKGWLDTAALKAHIAKTNMQVQVVFTSPLMRTTETACGVFGGDDVVVAAAANGDVSEESKDGDGGRGGGAKAEEAAAAAAAARNREGAEVPSLPAGMTSSSAAAAGPLGAVPVPVPVPVPLLMEGQEEELNVRARHAPIAAVANLPFIADDRCRERMSLNRCDRHRPLSQLKAHFPGIDFSRLEEARGGEGAAGEEDRQWDAKHEEALNENAWGSRFFLGERGATVAERGLEFLQYLKDRPETEVAVVTHSEFLRYTLSSAAEGCSPELRQALSRRFYNCEMRSVKFDADTMKPVALQTETSFSGQMARLWLFPVNYAARSGSVVVSGLMKRSGWW